MVSFLLKGERGVFKVSIIPRGKGKSLDFQLRISEGKNDKEKDIK